MPDSSHHAAIDEMVAGIRNLNLSPEEQQMLLRELVPGLLTQLNVSPKERMALLEHYVQESWPSKAEGGVPSFSEWDKAHVRRTPEAGVSAGTAIVFKENGQYYTVLAKPGTHYKSKWYQADPTKPVHGLFGGYLNLVRTEGSAFVKEKDDKPEQPEEAAVREIGEEIPDDNGNPILKIDPKRLRPMDTLTIPLKGGPLVPIGFVLELDEKEAKTIKAHVARLEIDTEYRRAVRAHTINLDSGEPEICTVSIQPLSEVAAGTHPFLKPGEIRLYQKALADLTREEKALQRRDLFNRFDQFTARQGYGGRTA